MNVISCRNLAKVVLYEGAMGSNFESKIADFKEMSIAFIQFIYTGNDNITPQLQLWVSIDDKDLTFAYLPDSAQTLVADNQSICWNISSIGWRFLKLKFIANTNLNGTCRILAVGKKV